VADRPQDQPRPTGAGGPLSPQQSEIGARDVIAYLREHPDFLDRHPEALRLVRPPARKAGDGVLDFQHFLLERLRRDMVRLEDEHKSLISTSRGNLASQCRVHKAVVAMLRATSFEHLLQIVTTDLALLIDVDVVTLGVESTATRMTRLPVQGIHLLRSGTVDSLLGPSRDALLRFGQQVPAPLGRHCGLDMVIDHLDLLKAGPVANVAAESNLRQRAAGGHRQPLRILEIAATYSGDCATHSGRCWIPPERRPEARQARAELLKEPGLDVYGKFAPAWRRCVGARPRARTGPRCHGRPRAARKCRTRCAPGPSSSGSSGLRWSPVLPVEDEMPQLAVKIEPFPCFGLAGTRQ